MVMKRYLALATLGMLVGCVLALTAADQRSVLQTRDPEAPVHLQDLVQEALARNPEIQAARCVVDSKQARVPQIAERQTDAARLNCEAAQRRIVAEVKQAYLDLCFVHQSLIILQNNRNLLQRLARLAESRYASGKGAQQDMVRAQLEQSMLLERLTILGQTRQTLEAQLDGLRNLPLDTPVGKTENARLSEPGYSVEQLTEAAAHLESSQEMQASKMAQIRFRIKQECLEIQSSERRLRLYSETIVPQASLAVESSVSSYDEGTTDFLSIITNFETKLNYELNYQRQLVDHEKALARIEEMTGLTLIQQ